MNLSIFSIPVDDTPRYIGCGFKVIEIQDRIIYLTSVYKDKTALRLLYTTSNDAIVLINKECGDPAVYDEDHMQGPYKILSVQHLGFTDTDTLTGKFRIIKMKLQRMF